MTFIGSKQSEILGDFSKKYGLDVDYKSYRVRLGNKWALYRGSNPSLIRNNKLNKISYRWEWKKPLGNGGESPEFNYVILHGMRSRNAEETIFPIEKESLEAQTRQYSGQKEKVSLDTDTSPGARHNKRTRFFFAFAKGPDEFRAWLKRVTSS
jgi:hypothetical protein